MELDWVDKLEFYNKKLFYYFQKSFPNHQFLEKLIPRIRTFFKIKNMNSKQTSFEEPKRCPCCRKEIWGSRYTKLCEDCNLRVCSECYYWGGYHKVFGGLSECCMACAVVDSKMFPCEFEDPPRAQYCCSERAEKIIGQKKTK